MAGAVSSRAATAAAVADFIMLEKLPASGRMRYGESRQRRQPRSIRCIRQGIERLQRARRLTLGEARGIFEATGGIDGGNDGLELRQSTILDGEPDGSL